MRRMRCNYLSQLFFFCLLSLYSGLGDEAQSKDQSGRRKPTWIHLSVREQHDGGLRTKDYKRYSIVQSMECSGITLNTVKHLNSSVMLTLCIFVEDVQSVLFKLHAKQTKT
jgi:hypothetical protein